MDYRKMWAVLFIGLAIWLVPSFFWMAYGLFNEAAATTSEIVGEGYDAVTGNEPVSHGAEHIGEVIVGFEVNDASRGWGQWVESPHQLPEITGSVFASRMVDGEERSTLPAAGLRSQLRLNWTPLRPVADDEPDSRVCRNFVDQEGRRLRSTGCMEWTSLRVRIGERSTHLCVDLHEASEGHNILGTVQDVAHWVHWNDWHLSDGDVPVAANCVALRPSGYPYDAYRVALHRPGESIPMGWLSVRFVGARPADMIRTPVDIGFGTPTFPQPN